MRYLANVVTLRYDSAKCTACGRCREVCAQGVFAEEKGRARITDVDLCIECGACEANCPSGALAVKSGGGLRLGHHQGRAHGKRAFLRLLAGRSGRCKGVLLRVEALAPRG